jgi:Fungal specific transcription factor domain
MPMIHRPRYLAAMNLAPNMRPPVCLRYSIWCMAASVSDKYSALTDHFYRRSRKYAEMDEMRGHGEAIITIAHCQAWVLLSLFDFKNMNFPRAWQGTHRAASLALMMGLNRLDGAGLDVKQCLPPPRDWTEREERRRTYWMCFCADRYASIGTGWPMTIDESDVSF